MKTKPVSLVKLVSVVLLVITSGCARQGYPTGGPKDEDSPVSLGCKPDNGSLHFDANEFYIQFDEYVVLKNPTNNILVSPPMKQQPEYTTKGKGVLVKIKDTLQENTTYLFQFKEAIADFNEGNLLSSFEYVFSTGKDMDTLMLGGRVLEPRSGKPWKETVTVMAYRDIESEVVALVDTIATFVQPDFVTRCDKQGFFAFHYIPAGRYRVVAFEDKNRNLRLDPTEAAAWDTVASEAKPSLDSNRVSTLLISQPETQRQRVTSSSFIAKGRIQIVTQLPLQHPVVSGEEVEWRLNGRRDTMNLWCLNPHCDSTMLVLSDNGLQDTLRLRFTEQKKGKRQKVGAKEEKTPLLRPLCDGNKAFYDDLRLEITNPIFMVSIGATAEVMYLKDSTVTSHYLVADSNDQIRIDAALKSGEKYHVHIAKGLFTDIYGNTSDSLDFDLTPKDYGTLTLHIDNRTGLPLVIEVLDKRDTVVQSSPLPTPLSPLTFKHLAAGDYTLRAILDANGDGRWTPGDYRLQRQPEQVIFFEKTLSLREKWEMEERWMVVKEKPRLENNTRKEGINTKLKRSDKSSILTPIEK